MLSVAVRRLDHARDLPLPTQATAESAGVDLIAAVAAPLTLAPFARSPIPTGIAIALPPGYEAQVRPRSGLAARHGLTVLNSPGTIDADYRGEILVILVNLGHAPFVVERGLRIAQLVVAPVSRITWRETATLPETGRGIGGFGSTGTATAPEGTAGTAATGDGGVPAPPRGEG
jgi:dUTP pyrophosphatase